MSKKKDPTTKPAAKTAGVQNEAAQAAQTYEAARTKVHAIKADLKKTRKALATAKATARQAHKTLKQVKKKAAKTLKKKGESKAATRKKAKAS
ncbi:hypothetical protein OH491_23800 [Termitidicoccus mucosus]|uniref:Uncharacterized protein n=1 Tax=Termitidicoccus mucosus TaxID=1184151 RepID=A0A178IQE2_9BACT|nr:hypothetical protein AW736_02695 [Opitutaceae bacterium TSB47]